MIIGHGDIASVLPDREDFIFFASGVSNSQETNEKAYVREFDLLMEQDTTKHIVYFSSLAIFYSTTRYTAHKLQMEEIIKARFKRYTIIRLGNIDWGTNPHTLINFFRNRFKEGKQMEIQSAWRYVVSKSEFLHWIKLIPSWNCEMNIPGKRRTVKQIVQHYIYGYA